MDIHVQHLASLCRIGGDKIKDLKRKVDVVVNFLSQVIFIFLLFQLH